MEDFDFSNQIEEVKTLLASKSKEDKSFGYSTLLHLQERSSDQPSAIQALTNRICSLLSSTISDIFNDDEEIAAQALKCLGFMIYHPTLVSNITEDVANLVVQSLVKLIMTTKMKAVCNLGVWCISNQQFSAAFLVSHFNSLLRAIIHAIDNPIGSLSTTFEAIQAVIKLAAQLGEKMRDTSNIWTPLIYRRLLSIDKRERDMTERCFLKIRSVICPPPLSLSKALAVDLKKKLLSEMKEMLQNPGKKFHAIQAWGLLICLLGSHALKSRHLVNEMLKIPEQTFSDSDPKLQIASLFDCPNKNCCSEDLCGILIKVLNEKTSIPDIGVEKYLKDKSQNIILLLVGEVAVCFLKQILIMDVEALRSKVINNEDCGYQFQSSGIKNCLEFVSRFMRLSLAIRKSDPLAKISATARVFTSLASVVCRLHLKQDILLFIEIIFDPLAQWLSVCATTDGEIQEVSIINEQVLWTESLNCLQRSQPPFIFDSSFLKIQASILETTLNHPISSISESAIAFWNHTYGTQAKLDYPHSLIPILDKLSRQGRISIHKRSPMFIVNDDSTVGIVNGLQRYKVATTHKRISKRVEFMEKTENDMEYRGIPIPGSKRKRLELTEHQKEVRRAQQGRERDCNGHGPGLRTYTNIDFSQGNDDSQESQELRNPQSILELLRRA